MLGKADTTTLHVEVNRFKHTLDCIYVCRMLFQTPINRASNPVTLSLERRITSISQQASSPYLLPPNTVLRKCVILKIVYCVCFGMDVHKSFVVACIASTNKQGMTAYNHKRFSTFTGDLRHCTIWLAENDCKDVCMDFTWKY